MNQLNYSRNKKFRSIFAWSGFLLITILLSLSLAACGSTTATSTTNSNTIATVAATAATNNTVTTGPGTIDGSSSTAASASNAAATVPASNAAATATEASNTQPVAVSQPVKPPVNVQAVTPDQLESNTVVGVVKLVSPAVVTVYNKARSTTSATGTGRGTTNPTPIPNPADPANPGSRTQGIGSGVIVSDKGYIVTNAHVVEGEQGITVAFNNGKKVVAAKVVGVDKTGDIAVLKIEDAVPAVAKFGDSSKLQVGETVITIGAALGDFRNSVTKGVVSGLNRTLDNTPSVYIQTDAPINHGNSGGPLLNLQGEIIGINTAVLRTTPRAVGVSDQAEGLGFAIPGNTAKALSDQLISKGTVSRPYFGITYQMITPALVGSTTFGGQNVPAVEGAWITGSRGTTGVVSGSPADKAGLKDNDVITAIDGITLNDNNPLVSVMLAYKPNDTIKLTVQRGNQTLTLNLTLAERPKDL